MRRVLLLLMALALTSHVEAQPPPRFIVQPRRVDFDRDPPQIERPEFQEDENSLPHQAAPIAHSIGILATAGSIPPAGLAADVAGRLWGPRMSEAVDEYVRQLAEEKPVLVEPAKDEKAEVTTARNLHRLLQERISRLPPAIVERYRRRVDADAQQLLADAESTRSLGPLRRLVRDYFNSGPTEKALAILGDAAFERGRFDEAISWWRMLAPLPSGRRADDLLYPAGTLDRDRVVAKEILALVFQGRFAEAERELALFEKTSAAARGTFAGEDDRYVAILRRWLERRRADVVFEETDPTWPSFGGAPGGNRVFSKPPSDRLWIDGPTWRIPLAADKAPAVVRLSAARAMAVPATPIHPIITGGQVVFADGSIIELRDLTTGDLRFRRGLDGIAAKADEGDETRGITISAGNGVVCARLGAPGRARQLLALDLAKEGALRWKVDLPVDEGTAFVSDPLVFGDRVYIVRKSIEDRRSGVTLDCLDLAGGQTVWSTRLADYDMRDGSPSRAPLLLADEAAIVVVSHAGFVMACDPTTGGRLWGIRYPSTETPGSPHDVAAAVLADGRLFAAPADAGMLFAADLATGRVVWERTWLRPPTDVVADAPTISEVVQIFGVVDGRLVFTDRSRLSALDAATGTPLWQQPAVGKLPGEGRGLIAGAWVFWPTADTQLSWRAVTQDTGELRSIDATPEYYEPTTLRNLPAGNVVFGQGCLVIAGPRELVAFVPPELRLEKLKRDAAQSKVEPATLGLLALAQRTVGQTKEADATLADLWSRVPFYEKPDWEKLFDQRSAPVHPTRSTKKTSPIELETMLVRNGERPVRPARPTPTLGKLEQAWGPVRGFAPRIESPGSDRLIVVDSGDLVLVDARDGKARWRRPWKQPLFWLGRSGDVVVAAGPSSIEGFAIDDGRPVWRRLAPSALPGRWALVDGRPQELVSKAHFIDFAFTEWEADRVNCLLSTGQELKLSLRTGAPVGRETPLEVGPVDPEPPPSYTERARHSIIHEANGEVFWAGAAGSIESLRQIGDPRAIVSPNWPTSLTGAPADLLAGVDELLALVPRNQGTELVCFDFQSMDRLWSRPPEQMFDGFDVRAAAIDGRAVYYTQRGKLVARSLKDGAVLWQQPLPANPGPWQVDRYGDTLVVWPRSASGVPFLPASEMPLLAPVALAWGRQGIGSLPILLVETDGRVRQRIDVPHDGGPAIVWAQGSYLYATAGCQVMAYRTVR